MTKLRRREMLPVPLLGAAGILGMQSPSDWAGQFTGWNGVEVDREFVADVDLLVVGTIEVEKISAAPGLDGYRHYGRGGIIGRVGANPGDPAGLPLGMAAAHCNKNTFSRVPYASFVMAVPVGCRFIVETDYADHAVVRAYASGYCHEFGPYG